MLSAECYKQRMERGLTFFELSYMLMQSYDFCIYMINMVVNYKWVEMTNGLIF